MTAVVRFRISTNFCNKMMKFYFVSDGWFLKECDLERRNTIEREHLNQLVLIVFFLFCVRLVELE